MSLFVISNWFKDHPKKKHYFESVADKSLFPIIDFNNKKITSNKLHKKILEHGENFEQKMGLIKKYIGAYVTSDNQSFDTERGTQIIQIKVTPSIAVTPKFMHGWYSGKTREALEGAMIYYKPKNVVELGVWYGKSTVGLLQASSRPINYYGFDYFTPTATNPDYVTQTPMDKLFIDHFRLESTVSNLAPYSKKHNINLIFYDVLASVDIMKNNNIKPDLVFIDAVKEVKPLQTIIDKYLELNPEVVIVGDDYVFNTVKIAVKKYKNIKIFGDNSYIITNKNIPESFPNPVSDFSNYPHLELTQKEKSSLPESLIYYV
jgi:predicted O-methyltransferase YrrM